MELLFPIHETFQATIQGEGALAGTLVDFIRLYGCPVGCWFCDTGYSQNNHYGQDIPYIQRTIDQLLTELQSPRVVISGGEPMIHRHLPQLIEAIEASDRHVSIETSGSRWQPISTKTWLTLSPKTHISKSFSVKPECWQQASEIKLVISDGHEIEFYQKELSRFQGDIFLQPEWTRYRQTLPLTLKLIQNHPDYRLSVQLHKLIGVP